MTIYVGTSGWSYAGWRGPFYPKGLVHRRELEYASRQYNSIEINGTLYSLQRPDSFHHWYEETPDDFVFALKGSRFITHMKHLRDAEAPLVNFFASGVLRLSQKLGPIVWQLPARFRFDHDLLAAFLAALPQDTDHAARLAKKHDKRVEGRSWTEPDHAGP